jgi:hypothetical protein
MERVLFQERYQEDLRSRDERKLKLVEKVQQQDPNFRECTFSPFPPLSLLRPLMCVCVCVYGYIQAPYGEHLLRCTTE